MFDHSDSEFWQTTLLMVVSTDGKHRDCKHLSIRKHGRTVRTAEESDKETILAEFHARNLEIAQADFVVKQYVAFADEMRNMHFQRLSGNMGRFLPMRVLNRFTGESCLDGCMEKRFGLMWRIVWSVRRIGKLFYMD